MPLFSLVGANRLCAAFVTVWSASGGDKIAPADPAVFIPFASIKAPTSQDGLENVGLWMGHRHTVWWRNANLPVGSEVTPSYDMDGWCQFEVHMSGYVKKSGRRIDLTRVAPVRVPTQF